jgi:hypothetical protein
LLLSVYLWVKKTSKIFWWNLFEDKKLLKIFEEMVWNWNKKPFECIWTFEEVQTCFAYLWEKWEKSFMVKFMEKYKFKNNLKNLENFFWDNLIEKEFLKILKKV